MPDSIASDYDSPWKEALDAYFEPALLFPSIHTQVNWLRGCESLDKEFQQVVRDAEVGRRYVDKLVNVWTKEGAECWVLIHVEVQTTRDADFPLRMFVYHYRIFDRYNKPVVSLAVLADDDPQWRPTEFRLEQFGCESVLRFPIVKLCDFQDSEAELETSENPFARVVLAHLKARQTQHDPQARHTWKLRLIRNLYDSGFGPKDVRELFRVIDWMMRLPETLEVVFWRDVAEIQQEKQMPFITTPERVGRRQGLRKGIKTALKIKFGDEGLQLMPDIEQIHETDQLESILDALETATTLDEVC